MTVTDHARIELEPEPDRLLDSADGAPPIPQNTRSTVFGDRYVRAIAVFEAAIDRDALAGGRIRDADTRHPRATVRLGGEEVEFVYDGDLDQQLLTVYVLYGWAGIEVVEDGITRAEKGLDGWEGLHYPWPETRTFFELTRNLLYAGVIDELVAFERAAAEAISPRLNDARDVAGAAWDALRIRKATDEEARFFETHSDWEGRTAVSAGGRRRELAWYTVGNTDLLGRILEVVTPLVADRERLIASRRKRDAIESDARRLEHSRLVESQAERDDLSARIDELVTKIEDDYARLYGISQVAVLTVPQLRTPVGPEGLAGAIVALTIDVIDEAERIQRSLDAGSRWVTGVLGDPRSVVDAPTVTAPERAVAEKALAAVDDDPRYLSMLNLVTLAELTGRADGLAYVVRSQYVAVLMEVMDEQERSREIVATIMGVLAKVAALVSLVSMLTPVGWVMKAVAVTLDAGAIAYQVHAAVGQLAQFDRAVDEALLEFDRAEMEKLARLSELIGMRPAFVEQLTTTVVVEIGLIVAAGAYPAFRRLVHVRGYYNDIETLLEPL